jgi:UDP:flavonoid glycosyltransferase YjiC (YdhE family)
MKILCLPYTHTLSHISRPLAIALEFRNRGHEVVFAGDSSKDGFIKGEGFEVLPLYQLQPDLLFGRIRNGDLKFVTKDELDKMIAADRELYRQVKPDLVLSDGRFSAPISTAIDHIPHAAIVNVSSTEYRKLPYIPFFDWLPEKLVPQGGSLKLMLDRVNLALEMFVFDNASSEFKKLTRQLKLTKKVTATNCLAGNDLTLLADIEEYFPARNLPANYHYIGPLTWKSTLDQPSWWPPPKLGDLLAYFTMGTTWMGGSFEALYEMIRSRGMKAVIATGGQKTSGLKSDAEGIYIEEFVDGDLVMELADVVVCHGGNGTIYQALQHGKPIVGIPTIPDQEFNMRRVCALGAGEKLSLKDFNSHPGKLFNLVQKVANTSTYRKNAEIMQEKLAALKPAQKAADLIETMMTCK